MSSNEGDNSSDILKRAARIKLVYGSAGTITESTKQEISKFFAQVYGVNSVEYIDWQQKQGRFQILAIVSGRAAVVELGSVQKYGDKIGELLGIGDVLDVKVRGMDSEEVFDVLQGNRRLQ